jgi:predicted transcriptional regulator
MVPFIERFHWVEAGKRRRILDGARSAGNRDLLRVIAEKTPGSLDELGRITGKAKSNLSRTLRTMEGYGLVRLERGERGRITPKVMHDRVELDLPLTLSPKAS